MIRYFILICCLLYGLFSKGQAPVGEFSASVTSNCSPVVVNFKDQSTGNPKFWNWDLGNGQLSNQQNPVGIYTSPGKYSVTLVVRNPDGTDGITKKDLIVVNPSPQAEFSVNINTVCLPAVVSFRDLSIPNAGVLTKWYWDFGDGTTSTQQNPQKTYTTTGYYSVSLTVTSSTGCTSQNGKSRFIRVVSGVTAAFIDSITPVCRTPVEVKFMNETSGPGQLSYAWTFGNGNNSSLSDPMESYIAAGNYNVRLIASSDFGCSDTADKTVIIGNKVTSFTAPDTTCINQPVSFINGNASALKSNWDFGDLTTNDESSPVKTYPATGIYVVTLRNNYGDCKDSAKKTITVIDLPTVTFSSDNVASCKAPFTVNFQDNSIDAVAWAWDFGDGSTASGKSPAHTYTTAGRFDVSLTITSRFGCQNTLKQTAYINIVPPTVTIANAPTGGCIPFAFSPLPGVVAIDGVAGYAWNFGDGSPISTSQTPSHTYPLVGNYELKLTITTNGGCVASVTIPNGVKTGTLPSVNFSVQKTTSCAADSIQFTDLSNPADQWVWNFGDGNVSAIKNPKHAYDSAGIFDITLTAFNNGCPITLKKPALVTIKPPIAKFDFSSDCNNRRVVKFINESVIDSLLPVTYLWEFGDALKTTSRAKDTSFTYPALGKFTVKLTITNGQCNHSFTKEISLISDIADFTASKTALCKNEKLTLTAINSNAANISEYSWKVNGSIAGNTRTFETSFPATGVYDISLQITDINGCSDTKSLSKYITITGPQAAFTTSVPAACVNTPVTFNDASTPVADISKWTFTFGDGTSQTFTRGPFTHAFKDTGNFQVILKVEDKQGCTHEASAPRILITKPVASFVALETKICPGTATQFQDSSRGYALKYMWDFGDGVTSDLVNPTHTYAAIDKMYTVKLTVTDTSGCSETLTRSNYIDVRSPKAAFDIKDTVTLCPPLETKFFFKGRDYESFYWDFGDGGSSSLANPTHFYNSYGTFTAKLFVTGYGGCIDSSERQVHVYDPYSSTVKYSPLEACNTLQVDFTITTPPGTFFQLVFGDGLTDERQVKSLTHFYNSPSFYTPYILLKDSLDCQVFIPGTETIKVIGAEPFFSIDKKNFCDSGTVFLTNYTIGNDPVVSDTWNFGDGQTSSERDPSHTYKQPGTYIVSHIVQTQSGCSKTITDTVRIYRTPDPAISSRDIICINSPELLQGVLAVVDTAIKWNWILGDGQTSALQDVNHTYTKTGQYTLTVEAVNLLGCKGSDTKIIQIAPLPVITVIENPVISGGTSIKLPVTYSQNVITYNWNPATALDCATCPNPVATPQFNTVYKIAVTDSNNCKSAGELTVTVICNNRNYFVPNTFSPNGDGVNDVFYPRGASIDKIQSMRIFNRWGELVFEKRNFPINSQADGWNGSVRGKPANGDVYVYVIEFVCENATVISYKGNIALIR